MKQVFCIFPLPRHKEAHSHFWEKGKFDKPFLIACFAFQIFQQQTIAFNGNTHACP